MGIQVYSDKEGDRIVGSYSEARDPDGKVVVRRVENRAEAATYRTPFAGAQLNIITRETFGRPESDGVTPKYFTIQVIGMAESPTRDRCEKWAVPAELIEQARSTAIAAVEVYASNVPHRNPVRNIVAIANDVRL